MRIKINYIIVTIIFLSIALLPFANTFYSSPQAGPVCSAMGNMSVNSIGLRGLVKGDEPNRKWTIQEVFGKSVAFTSYYGEGPGDWIYANKVDRGAARAGSDWNDATVQDNLKAARGLSCLVGKGDFFPNMGLSLSKGISGLLGKSIGNLVGQDGMSDTLVEIIGGENGEDGLLSIMFNSIYTPLVVIAFLFTAIALIYKGLIQMKLREALSSIIWSVSAFIVGVTLMLIPGFLVKMPQAVTNTITTCVLGALNGQNCLTGDVTTPSLLTGIECASRIAGDTSNADMMVNGMSCTIWKSFVLEPWAEEQFGEPYQNLYTYNPPSGGSIWSGLDGDGSKYCVNLASTSSPESTGSTVVMDRNDNATVCNVALYQLFLMTDMEDPINQSGNSYQLTTNINNSDSPYDERWYDIIVPMAKHSSNWKIWSGQGRLLGRIASSTMSNIALIAASFVLISLSVFAGVYKISAIILMAFAPLFFLFAIEPNRGKKIFLGWVEAIISSLLKYFAITMLIIVSLVLYAGVLSTTYGPTSFIAVIVLTAALLMYRKEIVDLIGASNMGGQRLSNQAKKVPEWLRKQTKEKGSAVIGGAIGGAIGADNARRSAKREEQDVLKELQRQHSQATARRDDLAQQGMDESESEKTERERIEMAIEAQKKEVKKHTSIPAKASSVLSGMGHGVQDSTGRALRRGTSLTATAFKQSNMTKDTLERKYASKRSSKLTNLKADEEKIYEQPQTDTNDNVNNDNAANDKEKTPENNIKRDKVKYSDNLTPEEISALDKFAKDLSNIESTDDLINVLENEDYNNDENKKQIVANEINARIKMDLINPNVNAISPELIRAGLVSLDSLSSDYTEHLATVTMEKYIKTGDEKDLDFCVKLETYKKSTNINGENVVKMPGAMENLKDEIIQMRRENMANNNPQEDEPTPEDSIKEKFDLKNKGLSQEAAEEFKEYMIKPENDEAETAENKSTQKEEVRKPVHQVNLDENSETDKEEREIIDKVEKEINDNTNKVQEEIYKNQNKVVSEIENNSADKTIIDNTEIDKDLARQQALKQNISVNDRISSQNLQEEKIDKSVVNKPNDTKPHSETKDDTKESVVNKPDTIPNNETKNDTKEPLINKPSDTKPHNETKKDTKEPVVNKPSDTKPHNETKKDTKEPVVNKSSDTKPRNETKNDTKESAVNKSSDSKSDISKPSEPSKPNEIKSETTEFQQKRNIDEIKQEIIDSNMEVASDLEKEFDDLLKEFESNNNMESYESNFNFYDNEDDLMK